MSESFDVADDAGSVVTKKRNPEDLFIRDLIANYIDRYGQYLVHYKKFRKMVAAEPLMPDQQARKRIADLERETKRAKGWLVEAQAQLESDIRDLEDAKADAAGDKDELDRSEKEIEEAKARFAAEKQQSEERAVERSSELTALYKRSKISLDDEKDYS